MNAGLKGHFVSIGISDFKLPVACRGTKGDGAYRENIEARVSLLTCPVEPHQHENYT